MGGGAAVAHPPVPAALSRLRSDESKSTVDSPMSTSSAGPSGQAEPPRPATHLPPASGGADGPAGDSSDEEGAHRPPSPERPPPAPAAPPAPPFAQPTMQLAQGLRPFSAGPLPAADAAPRTTRVSDEDRKELHRARLEAQAAAEKERGPCERTPIAKKKKKRDDDGILSLLVELVPAILDDLRDICANNEELMAFLARVIYSLLQSLYCCCCTVCLIGVCFV